MEKPSLLRSITGFIFFGITSWLMIHILAILGFFLAIAYPIWWFFFPKSTVCLLCRVSGDEKACSLCKKAQNTTQGSYPKTLTSTIVNSVIIFLLFSLSLGVIFIESRIIARLDLSHAQKTVSFNIPSSGQYRIGEIFPLKVDINGVKTPINTVQMDIGFDPKKIEIVDISTKESFASIFVQKEISNSLGFARISGGLPNPGCTKEAGTFATVYFRAREPGVLKVDFLPSSMVLANDSEGTNVLKDFSSVSYLILPESLSKEEQLSQDKIFNKANVLGESIDNTKMVFYDSGSVFTTPIAQKLVQNKGAISSPQLSLIGLLHAGDNFILNFWSKLFE